MHLNSHDFVFCCGFKPLGQPAYVIGLRDVDKDWSDSGFFLDRPLLREVKRHLEYYDGWIGWNKDRFDRPFIDDRLLMCGVEMLEERFHIDLMKTVKWPKSRTQSASLDWCAKQFGCPYKKTPLDITGWVKARNEVIANVSEPGSAWKKLAPHYDNVVAHNVADLQVTEWMMGALKPKLRVLKKAH